MTHEEVDAMWQQAMRESIKDGEVYIRYHFAKLVAEKALAQPEQEPVDYEKLAALGWQAMECTMCGGGAMGYPRTEQEPVAWMDADGNVSDNNDHKCFPIPIYTKEQP